VGWGFGGEGVEILTATAEHLRQVGPDSRSGRLLELDGRVEHYWRRLGLDPLRAAVDRSLVITWVLGWGCYRHRCDRRQCQSRPRADPTERGEVVGVVAGVVGNQCHEWIYHSQRAVGLEGVLLHGSVKVAG